MQPRALALPLPRQVLGHPPSGPHTAVCAVGAPPTSFHSPDWEGNPEMQRVRQGCRRGPEAHLVPVQPLLVHQDPHQLGDGQGGVGVIQLDGHLRLHGVTPSVSCPRVQNRGPRLPARRSLVIGLAAGSGRHCTGSRPSMESRGGAGSRSGWRTRRPALQRASRALPPWNAAPA